MNYLLSLATIDYFEDHPQVGVVVFALAVPLVMALFGWTFVLTKRPIVLILGLPIVALMIYCLCHYVKLAKTDKPTKGNSLWS